MFQVIVIMLLRNHLDVCDRGNPCLARPIYNKTGNRSGLTKKIFLLHPEKLEGLYGQAPFE